MRLTLPKLKIARRLLEEWGDFWYRRKLGETDNTSGPSAYSVFQEIMVLGTRIQKTNTRAHMMLSSSIRRPDHIRVLDEFLEGLPEGQRAALTIWYENTQPRDRDEKNRPAVLLRAELAVADFVTDGGRHIEEWAKSPQVQAAIESTQPVTPDRSKPRE